MITQSLNGVWSAASADDEIRLGVPVPGSVYSAMLDNGMLEDPYYGLNQYEALKIAEKDFIFRYDFIPEAALLQCERIYMRFQCRVSALPKPQEIFQSSLPIHLPCWIPSKT